MMKPMRTGTLHGLWWLPEVPSTRVSGVLSLNHELLDLELIGAFGPLGEMGRVQGYPVVHGTTTDGLRVTLIDAIVTAERISSLATDVRSVRLRPSTALVGALLNDPVRAVWRVCSVELERLTAWTSPTGLRQQVRLTEDRHLQGASIEYEVPPPTEVALPGSTLTIGPAQSISGDRLHEARITITAQADFAFEACQTVDVIVQRYVKPLVYLVTLATQRPTATVTLRVAAEDAEVHDWVEVVAPRAAPSPDHRRALYPPDALFLLPDLLNTGPDAVARWYQAASRYESVLDLVSAVRSSARVFLDHRFLNTATAAEAYHEERYDGKAMASEDWKKVVEAAIGAAPSVESYNRMLWMSTADKEAAYPPE
jgi:hypothetical protein